MVEVKEINYLELNEDVRTEAERVLSMATSVLIQRILVSNEYPVVAVRPESKPFMRELIEVITGAKIMPGYEHMFYVRLMTDTNKEPVFHVRLHDRTDNLVTENYFRFLDLGDLFQIHYKRCYDSLKAAVEDELDISMLVVKDFKNALGGIDENHTIYFGIAID